MCREEILIECQSLFAADEVEFDKSAAFFCAELLSWLLKNELLLAVWNGCSHNSLEQFRATKS
jgi:hypothetical protein